MNCGFHDVKLQHPDNVYGGNSDDFEGVHLPRYECVIVLSRKCDDL